jgi:hypothetical protein
MSVLRNIDPTYCKIWHIPSKQQIWIKSDNDKYIWLYHYAISGAFTKRRLYTGELRGMAIKQEIVYCAIGSTVMKISGDTRQEDTTDISSTLRTKRFICRNDFLIKRIDLDSYNVATGTGTVEIGSVGIPIGISTVGTDIYGDNEDIYGDTNDIWESPTTTLILRCNYRTKAFDITVNMTNGGIALRNISIGYAEV